MNGEDGENSEFLKRIKAGLEDGPGPDPAVLAAIRLTAIRANAVRRRRAWALPVAAAAALALACALPFLMPGGDGPAAVPLTVQAIALIGESDGELEIDGTSTEDGVCDSLLAWQDAPYEAVAKTEVLEDNILP